MSKIIKGFKAFNKGLECKGFKYEVGKEYKHDGEIKLCEKGFHFCENPLDVLDYYNLCDSEFAEVETDGKVEREEKDSKICSDKIKINSKIDLPMFIKASFNFVWEKCNQKGLLDKAKKLLSQAASGYSAQLAASGNYAKLAASGSSAQLAASGDSAQLAASGDSAQLAASGNYAKLAASGNYAKLAASGDSAQLAASGNYAKLAASGSYAKLAASGDSAQLEINGIDSVGANIGVNGIIKGKKGDWITLAEYKDNKPYFVKSERIDGKKIKEDVWYKLEDKKFKEVK